MAARKTITDPRPVEAAEAGAPEDQLRPERLADFTGQARVCENLGVFVAAARKRGEALDHVLLSGPPGLGKTTLARIVARELGVGFHATSGPVIARAGDLAALLTNLQPRDVLFIDEIHRLQPVVEEILYPAMEDFELDLIIGEGPAARSVRIELQPFTLVGATTRTGLLTTPLRDRFGIPLRLDFYDVEELEKIVRRGARLLGLSLTPDGAHEIARRARGTPRVAGRLLRRVRDFATAAPGAADVKNGGSAAAARHAERRASHDAADVKKGGSAAAAPGAADLKKGGSAAVAGARTVDAKIADAALTRLEVDGRGLDAMDRRYLGAMAEHYGGGPVGVETLAAALSEQRDALEEVIEPFLLQQGLLQRTPRGRVLTEGGWRHLGLAPPAAEPPNPGIGAPGAPPSVRQLPLLDDDAAPGAANSKTGGGGAGGDGTP